MKLDTGALRYLAAEDWRVLTAVEMGSKNHEVVPTPLICNIAGLRGGSSINKSISTLAKANLIAKVKNAKYDGYRLTYGGLDYLALHAHTKKSVLYSVGNQIGIGKESDIFVVAPPPTGSSSSYSSSQCVLKIHRLGRISFRTVKSNRDYLRGRSTGSWMYMSRLSALKEYTFMTLLSDNGFVMPRPIAHNRHTIVMEFVEEGIPLRQVKEVPDPAALYADLIEMIIRLATFGLIHGDFNEFNVLIKEEIEEEVIEEGIKQTGDLEEPEARQSQEEAKKSSRERRRLDSSPNPRVRLIPVVIDFPQMVSTSHPNASMYFDRDVRCIKSFFARRFGFHSDEPGPFFAEALKLARASGNPRLDVKAEASGFSKKMSKDLETYVREIGAEGDEVENGQRARSPAGSEEDEEDEEDEEEEDDGGDEDQNTKGIFEGESKEDVKSQSQQEDVASQVAAVASLDQNGSLYSGKSDAMTSRLESLLME